MRNKKSIKIIAALLVMTVLIGSAWTAAQVDYRSEIRALSRDIRDAAAVLSLETDRAVLDSSEIEFILDDLKEMIKEYENTLVFAESPYPGEIILGRTPHINDSWHETDCQTRYEGPMKELRIRRTGSSARYLRINDIEITYETPSGLEKQTFNKNARIRLYRDEVFKLALPEPMRIRNVRILVEHDSNGLIISGIPYKIEPPRRRVEGRSRSGEMLLGTTPAGKDTWLETICDNPTRPVRQIQLKRTGQKTLYLRINDIEITYISPDGIKKEIFNHNGRIKLYYGQTYGLVLPEPMRVTHIRILIGHESTGLQVYGIY